LTTCWITVRCAGWSSFVIVQVFCSPAAIVPPQSAESEAVYPDGPPVSATPYVPAASKRVVPAALPTKDGRAVPLLVTVIVQALGAAAPPLSFTTCLTTVSCGAGRLSSFVRMQVFVSPRASAPVHPAETLVLV